jgi:hypothetical protein
MAVLAVTIKVYAELPDDDYDATLDHLKRAIKQDFSDYGLQAPVIVSRAGIPARIGNIMEAR